MSKIANNKKEKNNSNKVLKLEEKNKILEAEIKELKSKNIALLAEFDNYKKRVYNQMSNDKKYEGKDIFVNIIPIIDDIERVLIVEDVDSKSIISGIDLIKNTKINETNITVQSSDSTQVIPKIFQISSEIGLGIDSFVLNKPTLDDVFISHTGHNLRDGTNGKFNKRKSYNQSRRRGLW